MTRWVEYAEEGETQAVTVSVPGRRLGWLTRELDALGVPYTVERSGDGYRVLTSEAAQGAIERVVGYKPAPKRRQAGGISTRAWLWGGAVFTVLFGLYDLSTWGHHERTIPWLLGWNQGETAGAFAVAAVLVAVWFRLATGKSPAGYRPLVPGWLLLLALLYVVGAVFLLAANGQLY